MSEITKETLWITDHFKTPEGILHPSLKEGSKIICLHQQNWIFQGEVKRMHGYYVSISGNRPGVDDPKQIVAWAHFKEVHPLYCEPCCGICSGCC